MIEIDPNSVHWCHINTLHALHSLCTSVSLPYDSIKSPSLGKAYPKPFTSGCLFNSVNKYRDSFRFRKYLRARAEKYAKNSAESKWERGWDSNATSWPLVTYEEQPAQRFRIIPYVCSLPLCFSPSAISRDRTLSAASFLSLSFCPFFFLFFFFFFSLNARPHRGSMFVRARGTGRGWEWEGEKVHMRQTYARELMYSSCTA